VAHDAGIVHRDIKPGNILLSRGEPLVADFGIALAISAAGGGRMTETGLSLGTPHYMSPEQASADRELTARSDVYSLACVLYEMLAGQPPHAGPTAQSVLVRILTEEPRPVGEVRATVPRHVRSVLDRGLEKLPADRFGSAEEFKSALDDLNFTHERIGVQAATTGAVPAGAAASSRTRRGVSPGVAAALAVPLAVAALGIGWLAGRGGAPATGAEGPVVSFVLLDSAANANPAVGPDGTLAWVARGTLHTRRPGSVESTVLVDGGRDGRVIDVTFSPDGSWVAFTQQEDDGWTLKKMPTAGGPAANLWSSDGFMVGARWGDDGNIYLLSTAGDASSIVAVPDIGGEPGTVFRSDATLVLFPSDVLPGGRGLLFTHFEPSNPGGRVVALDLATGDTATVVADGFDARWSPTGHLVYGHASGALWAVPFDTDGLEPTGPPAPVLDGVGVWAPQAGRFDFNDGGLLSYAAGAAIGSRADGVSFALVDASGTVEPLPLEPTDHQDASVSPDGTRMAYTRDDDIWIFDLDLGTNDSLTAGGPGQHNPVWSPDGTRVAYRSGNDEVSVRLADRSAEPVVVGGAGGGPNPAEWLEDGTLLFSTDGFNGGGDVYAVSVEGGDARPLLQADWAESSPRVSPDGNWIAYQSGRSGTAQIYVRTWPDLRNEVQISDGTVNVAFASPPLWSVDGQTLYYAQGGTHWAAELSFDGGVRVEARTPTGVSTTRNLVLDVGPDGRFLAAVFGGAEASASDLEEPTPDRLIVVTHWFEVLRERLGEDGG
jgi:serine/threonine-protein kinase